MGILLEPCQQIEALVPLLPEKFSVCELGDQWVTHTTPHELARHWYKRLGRGRYESIDGNGRGTITADLNRAFHKWADPDLLHGFDLVTDFGTGEHVFDQAQVWRTIHLLTKCGGFIAFDRPCHGYEGHCFYNSHYSLFEDIAAANSYHVRWLERGYTKRGQLVRGIFRKDNEAPFVVPQQGRYKKLLRPITEAS